MTRGATRFLDWLRWRGGRNQQCWWKQAKIAEDLHCSVRSVQRWERELIDEREITVTRTGRHNLYVLSKSGGKQRRLQLENVGSDATESRIGKPAYKNLGMKQKESSAQLVFSDEEIRHPEVQRVLRRAQERINRADNPEAYAKRIVADTLARLRKPAQVETVSRPAVAMTPEVAAFIAEHQTNQRRLGIVA